MSKKCLIVVTGAAGYIGGQTMLQLRDQGHTVVGIDRRPLPDHLLSVADRFIQEDFSSGYSLGILDTLRPDAIIHCAGSIMVGESMARPDLYYDNNFVKTKTLLDHLLKQQHKCRVIFSSSAATYGEPVLVPCCEEDPAMPINPYGDSKLMVEMIMLPYRRAFGLDYVAFRYFNACGADPSARHGQAMGASHIIARVLESLRDDREFTLNGDSYPTPDGTCIRDYVHVSDIVDAHIRALNPDVPSGVYNLGNSRGISNREVIEAAQRITGRQLRLNTGPIRDGDPAILSANAGKFSVSSGWNPQWQLDDIISHAWAWYNK